jgi:hypothetical protein
MKESQREAVIEHLKKKKSLTSWEAITLYGITRLASIIFNLRAEGYSIFTKKEGNDKARWAKYVLMKAKPATKEEVK